MSGLSKYRYRCNNCGCEFEKEYYPGKTMRCPTCYFPMSDGEKIHVIDLDEFKQVTEEEWQNAQMTSFLEKVGLLSDLKAIQEERGTSEKEIGGLMFGYIKHKELLDDLAEHIKLFMGVSWVMKGPEETLLESQKTTLKKNKYLRVRFLDDEPT